MKMMKYFCQICLIAFSGCTVGPQYTCPDMDVPCEWHSPLSEGMQQDAPDCFLWWESLNDPVLNWLIERAAEQNLDLYIAGTRVLEARMEWKGKTGDLYPHIDATANVGQAYLSKQALNSVFPCTHTKRNLSYFEVGFDADWEIDLFGVTAHEMCALKADIQASKEAVRDMWITLSAEIARNYIELRGTQKRLDLIQKHILSQQDAVNLTQELFRIGKVGTIDLKQTEEQLNVLRAQKPLIELSINKTIHRLSILLGYSPGELFCELSTPSNLPCLPNDKPIGLPSELLRRRPDIRKAERNLAAATERVGSAVAALFPRFSLYGFIGSISTQLHSLLNSKSNTYAAGPQLLLPIFNSKALLQDVDLNKLKTQQALYEYQKTVLSALEETENAFTSYHYELERNQFLSKAQQNAQESLELTQQLYQIGFKDYLEVLVVNRSFLDSEEAYIQSQLELIFHYISLYKALGGGWQICE